VTVHPDAWITINGGKMDHPPQKDARQRLETSSCGWLNRQSRYRSDLTVNNRWMRANRRYRAA
jgi:hypothetical protein